MSAILSEWLEGRGFPGTLVIDGHIHVGEWPHAATFRSLAEAEVESLRYIDSNGIDAICAVSGGYIFGKPDYQRGNDFLLALWERIPERLIPFMSVNPNDTRAAVLAELERMYAAGVRCIKLINAYQGNYPGDGPNLMALYEYAAEKHMLVFDHAWSETEIQRIAALFPQVDFVFGHYGGGYQDEAMLKFPNVYTNIWSYGSMGWLERGLQRVGAHKFMLGSDGFLNSLSVGSGPVVFADVSDEDKRMVLGLNAARLLDKVGALPQGLMRRYHLDFRLEPGH